MCKMASSVEAIFRGGKRHKIHDLAWLGHLKPSHMCVDITGWPYSPVRLIMPLKQASLTQPENLSFVVIDMCFCDEKTRLSWIKG